MPVPSAQLPSRAGNMLVFASRMRRVIACSVSSWFSHRASSKGAALAFYTLFSIAPVLLLVIAIAGFFYGPVAVRGELLVQLRELVGVQGAETIQLVLAGASNHDEGRLATLAAGALLIFGATSVFAELKASLDEIWQVPALKKSGIRDVLHTRLLSFGLVVVLACLLMVSLLASAVLGVLEHYLGAVWKEAVALLSLLSDLISFTVIAALFAVIYKMLPRVRLSWSDVAIGAFGTALMFALGKYVIGLYLGNSGVASSFGAAGSMIALLLWVYYSAQIFFLGAEFARQYALQMGSLRPAEHAEE